MLKATMPRDAKYLACGKECTSAPPATHAPPWMHTMAGLSGPGVRSAGANTNNDCSGVPATT